MFLFNRNISPERLKQLRKFQRNAHIKFKDLSLLNQAFIHCSATKNRNKNNERLEFLGDAVLGLVVAGILLKQFPNHKEGELARIKSASVSEDALVAIANDLQVSEFLILGKGELMSGGKNKKTILADTVEAVIGAFYLDSGFKPASKFVSRIIKKQINLVTKHKCYEDFKSELQEIVQRKFKALPEYILEKTEGPDHNLRFWVSIKAGNQKFGPCVGKTKKDAEQNAASIACKELKN